MEIHETIHFLFLFRIQIICIEELCCSSRRGKTNLGPFVFAIQSIDFWHKKQVPLLGLHLNGIWAVQGCSMQMKYLNWNTENNRKRIYIAILFSLGEELDRFTGISGGSLRMKAAMKMLYNARSTQIICRRSALTWKRLLKCHFIIDVKLEYSGKMV